MYIYTHRHSILSRFLYTGPSALFGGGDDLGDDVTPRYEAGDDVTPRYDGVSPRSEVRIYIYVYYVWACVHVKSRDASKVCETARFSIFFLGLPEALGVCQLFSGVGNARVYCKVGMRYMIYTHTYMHVFYTGIGNARVCRTVFGAWRRWSGRWTWMEQRRC